MTASTVTRFAPSPTGYLHLGHAYAALFAAQAAERDGGRFLLRIEDIDTERRRPEFEDAIYEDLSWLGLEWEEPVLRQSDRMAAYGEALERLDARGLLYPCFCSRKDIRDEAARSGQAPHGFDGPLYPGLCRGLSPAERDDKMGQDAPFALRIDMEKALAIAGDLFWTDREKGKVKAEPGLLGDVVLARKAEPVSYHLAVTLDDHFQGISLVTRGKDLFQASHIHRLLQALFGLETPDYHHHDLLTSPDGRRYAKRDKALTLRSLREAGHGPEAVREMARGRLEVPDIPGGRVR